MGSFLAGLDWNQIGIAALETLEMLGGSLIFVVILGLPLGILLFLTGKRQLLEQPFVYSLLSFIVNVVRSTPFIILLILVMPITTVLVGTSLGVQGAIPPLVIASTPFFARLVETALREVDRGVIEAVQAMGATTGQLVFRVLLAEALPGLLAAVTVTSIALVSESAMSGVIGGGGLGDLAIRFGYQSFHLNVMIVTVLLLLVLVQILQVVGDRLVIRFSRR